MSFKNLKYTAGLCSALFFAVSCNDNKSEFTVERSANTISVKGNGQRPTRIFGERGTLKLYGDILVELGKHNPDLSLLVLRRADVVTHSSDDEVAENYVLLGPCEEYKNPEDKMALREFIENGTNKISSLVAKHSRGHSETTAFIKDFQSLLDNNISGYMEVLHNTVGGSLASSETCVPMGASLPQYGNMAIITLKDTWGSPNERSSLFSGLPASYLKTAPGEAKEWALLIIAHELKHVEHRTRILYECDSLDWSAITARTIEETEADIWAAQMYTKALETGFVKNADVIHALADYRALSVFYVNHNYFSIKNSYDPNDHITTQGFDTACENYENVDFDSDEVPGYLSIATDVNAIVDAVAGYYFVQDLMHKGILPKDYDENTTPAGIRENVEAYAQWGKGTRLGKVLEDSTVIEAQPEYFHAAMTYFIQSGGVQAYKSAIPDIYGPIVDDMISDYKLAIERRASPKLVNKELIDKIRKQSCGFIDYEFFTDFAVFMNAVAEEEAPDEVLEQEPVAP